MDHLIFVRKAYIPNFRPLVPFLHVKKFVVGGGWVLNWILVLRFGPNLELRLEAGPSLTIIYFSPRRCAQIKKNLFSESCWERPKT